MKYAVYHDESQEAGYWHGILLVPAAGRERLLQVLQQIRHNTEYHDPVSLKNLRRMSGPLYRCIRAWMQFASVSVMQTLKGRRVAFDIGIDRPVPQHGSLQSPIAAKFILFRVRDGHRPLTGLRDHAAKIETTFRMGLKGGLHLFAGGGRQIEIVSLHFDGYEHHHRHLDAARILDRIGPLRDDVAIAPTAQLFDGSSDHRKEESQPYDDCQLLQLTDLLVGGFRTVLGHATHGSHSMAATPLRRLVERWHEGPARMRESRWHRGFCISECSLESGEWRFADIRPPLPDDQYALPGITRES
jgi:hypothetical protein